MLGPKGARIGEESSVARVVPARREGGRKARKEGRREKVELSSWGGEKGVESRREREKPNKPLSGLPSRGSELVAARLGDVILAVGGGRRSKREGEPREARGRCFKALEWNSPYLRRTSLSETGRL